MAMNEINKETLRAGGIFYVAGLILAAVISCSIQASALNSNSRNGDRTFYWEQPITIFCWIAAVCFVVIVSSTIYEWERPYKPPVFSYKLTIKDEKHRVYLLADGEEIDYKGWREIYKKKFGDTGYVLHEAESNYYRYNIERIEDAIEQGNEMVETVNIRFNPKAEQVLIADSAKSMK